MRAWAYMLGGLAIWAIAFLAAYAAASLFETSAATRITVALGTMVALTAALVLTLRACAARRRATTQEDRWPHLVAALSDAIGLVAIAWQGLTILVDVV